MKLITTVGMLGGIFYGAYAQQNLVTEIISERTENSSTFLKSNGLKETIISAGVMHYLSNDGWLPISAELISDGNDRFTNTTNTFQSSFPATINSLETIVLTHGSDLIEIRAEKKWISLSSPQEEATLAPFELTGTTANHSTARLSYANALYADQYEIGKGYLKNDVILENPIPFLKNCNDDYFGFQEELTLPSGWKIVAEEPGNGGFISSGLFILDENGEKQFTIPAPIIYEKQDPSTDGSSPVLGYYYLRQQNSVWQLSTLVPTDWLKDPSRNYPIVIDPTFTAGGVDGGWMSAVNWVNNPAFVFVGVCCGNQEHRAWLQYNTTSINDASCVTNVELELTLNGVGGAAPELTHAYDMTGTPGPYPGISGVVLADMVSGWYTSFTLGAVATYGYYDLGPNADNVLEGQLPINWYQVALVFDNEPSTNWKRFTASACNLRVTYLDPPCTLLPVELTDYTVSCEMDKPAINWSTASELNNDYFTIWRSIDGNHFEEIKRIKGAGNSQSLKNYSWINDAETAAESYYKLSQTDLNGEITFFDIKRYENCSIDYFIIQHESGDLRINGEDIVAVSIRQANGTIVYEKTFETATKNPDVAAFEAASGVYFVTLQTQNGVQITKSIFVK